MTQRNITITVHGDDIQGFRYSTEYTEDFYIDLETNYGSPDLVLIESAFQAALDSLREKLGK